MEKFFSLDFEFKQVPIDEKSKGPRFIVEGFASTDLQDLVDDIIQLDALKAAASDLLKNNTVFLNHDRLEPIGTVLDAKFIEGKGLWIKVMISETRKDIQQLIKENILNKFSIGGQVLSQKPGTHPKTGKQVNFIVRIKLHEVSLVSLPANQDARGFSWSLEKSFGGIKSHRNGGDIKLKIKVKTDAQGNPIIVDGKYVPFDGQGAFKEMEVGLSDGSQDPSPDPTPDPNADNQPAVTTGIKFSDEDLDAIKSDEEGKAQTAVKVKQVEHLCDLLLDHPDEDVSKVAAKIKELTEGIDFGQAPKPAAEGLKAAEVETMVRKAFADAFADSGLTTTAPKPGPKGTQKGAPLAPNTDADPQKGSPEWMAKELERIKKDFPSGAARLRELAKLGSLGTPMVADPRIPVA